MSRQPPKKAPDPVDIHVGLRVYNQRKMLGMNQKQLGNLIGVPPLQIEKYENGSSRIPASNLYKVSHELKVAVEYFFEGLDENHGFSGAFPEMVKFCSNPDINKFAENYQNCPSAVQKELGHLIYVLSQSVDHDS